MILVYLGLFAEAIVLARWGWQITFWDVVIAAAMITGSALDGLWPLTAPWVAIGVLVALKWWNGPRGRRRRKAVRSLGAKSRARLAAVVRRARESALPRERLIPSPG